ncbi:MAG TPA: hypothetical protein VK427_22265, partial [Kofleriaceae bacterium]|nr:hypothetical protein [Kofleriaceae bacterium]
MTAILLVPGLFGGCASPTDEAVAEQEVVTTNLTTYTQGQNIVVSFTNMQGASSDWIAIARTTDSDSVYWAYAYTGGATSGTVTFTMPTFAPGTYEARAFYDWNGTQSFTVQQRSAPFTITGNTSLSPSSATYPLGQAVTINYTGFSGSTTDWVAIYKPGAADGNYIAWQFTGG